MRISTPAGLAIIFVLLILSIISFFFSATFPNQVVQSIFLLISMGLVFFSTHPLAHYIVARAYSVRVTNFFIAPSEFRKLPMKTAKFLGRMVPTLGTKLDRISMSKLNNGQRARIYGVGALASSILILIPLAASAIYHESILALILGSLFFFVNLGTELLFSTKVGDFAKMKKAYSQAH